MSRISNALYFLASLVFLSLGLKSLSRTGTAVMPDAASAAYVNGYLVGQLLASALMLAAALAFAWLGWRRARRPR